MARGVEEEESEFEVLSRVKTGHKRELAFALKSRSEVAGCLGRTRARKASVEAAEMEKREKGEVVVVEEEEEPESDVVDLASDDDDENWWDEYIESGRRKGFDDGEDIGDDERHSSGKRKRESTSDSGIVEERIKKRVTSSVSKPGLKRVEDSAVGYSDSVGTVSMKNVPTKLKELLRTGLLEGLSVRYMRSVKMKALGKQELLGVIRGCGVLCYCANCNGTKVVSPNEYELHAGSSNKRPADYTFLENGNSLRDVLNACKGVSLEAVEAVIRHASGCTAKKNDTSCDNSQGAVSQVDLGQVVPVSAPTSEVEVKEPTPATETIKCDRSNGAEVARKSSMGTAKLRVTGSNSQKRVTRKDLRLHKLVFDEDVLPDGTEVGYYVRGKKLLSGYKRGSGIFCLCCQKEVSPSQFEAHAGCAARRKPFMHIYTSNGVSLHELSVSLARTRNSTVEENDDLCGICFEAGELLCCDGCPRAFHAVCISLQTVPTGKWYCRYCQNMFEKERFAELNANAIAAGRIAGVDPIEQITQRCIRIMTTLDSDSSCCVLCRGHDFSRTGFGPTTVIICDQCEKEYHVGCLRSHKIQELKELPQGKWFCSSDCNRIHYVLQQLVKSGEIDIPDSLLDAMYKKRMDNASECDGLHIRWRLLNGKSSTTDETKLLLSKAVSVFHVSQEQFDPIMNPNSTQDLIPHMVYGRDLKDRDLGGMYCAILSINSVLVSAVVFRIFGKEVAEIPLVATSADSQGKGYFQSLYTCLETLLRDLGVKKLLLPAAEEARSLWTKFGFTEIQQDEINELLTSYNVMMFNGTAMLHKLVPML
ncbi:Increased DNA methylation 1-like protein [Drosera capensis]